MGGSQYSVVLDPPPDFGVSVCLPSNICQGAGQSLSAARHVRLALDREETTDMKPLAHFALALLLLLGSACGSTSSSNDASSTGGSGGASPTGGTAGGAAGGAGGSGGSGGGGAAG